MPGASLRTLPFEVVVFVPGVEISGDFFIFMCFDPESWTAVFARRMRDSRISVFLVKAANSRFRRWIVASRRATSASRVDFLATRDSS